MSSKGSISKHTSGFAEAGDIVIIIFWLKDIYAQIICVVHRYG